MRRIDVLVRSLVCSFTLGAAGTLARDVTPEPIPGGAALPGINQPANTEPNAPAHETLTNGSWDLGKRLADSGIEVALGSTTVYQANVRNGLGTHQKSGRLTGSYDIEIAADLEKSVGAGGFGLFVHGWGGWPATKGIDEAMVGSAFNVNWDAIGDRTLDVVEVILEWSPRDSMLTLQVGKINFANVFDTSEYANGETSQFLNGAFVNNPTVPIPDYCLGGILLARLTDSVSLAAGVGDAEADGRTTGFGTTFDGDDYFFYALEMGLRVNLNSSQGPRGGNYRFGLWYDPWPRACSDSEDACRDRVGIYASADQALLRENDPNRSASGDPSTRVRCRTCAGSPSILRSRAAMNNDRIAAFPDCLPAAPALKCGQSMMVTDSQTCDRQRVVARGI